MRQFVLTGQFLPYAATVHWKIFPFYRHSCLEAVFRNGFGQLNQIQIQSQMTNIAIHFSVAIPMKTFHNCPQLSLRYCHYCSGEVFRNGIRRNRIEYTQITNDKYCYLFDNCNCEYFFLQ